jgi:Methyltransferase domain
MEHIYKNASFGEDYFTYPALYKAMVDRFPSGSRFVEVGSFKGKSSAFMAVEIINSGKDIKFDCIDRWGDDDFNGYWADFDKNGIGNEIYQTFVKNIEPIKDAINVIRANSWESASLYEDASLDFVFIDADHEYESVVKDITAWLPKVKSGGVLAGHDYAWSEKVQRACDTCFGVGRYNDPWGTGCWILDVNPIKS